ncbi:YqaA family protein [Limibacillus halophilus]|jgi:membrane protein YqaA with SNARE-associated domain
MLRRLYDWTLEMSSRPNATRVLAAVAFIESSFFPIPPDAMIIPMIVADRAKAWKIAAVASIFSVLGGFFGYLIGYVFFDSIGQALLDFYGYQEKFETVKDFFNEWGGWFVAAAGFTPLPYKVITIASGVTQMDLLLFGVASAISRSARFFLEAAILWYFGPPVRAFVEKRLGLVAALSFALLIGGFLALKYLF